MGNSPSRNELHGDHMSSIANNSGQETFQSHSYPTKFSTVPGIHNEQFNGTVVHAAPRQPVTQTNQQRQECTGGSGGGNGGGGGSSNRNGGQASGGPNTPDLLYSMDSLNVCGNNGTSITSSELPPSSISPANCRDPWSPSSYSDESLHTQCRNLSRLHKDLHHRPSDDEGLSSSTYESDSLNPAATLSGMAQQKQALTRPYPHHHHHQTATMVRRETSPQSVAGKPEIAEEATELDPPPLIKSQRAQENVIVASTNPATVAGLLPGAPHPTDHSITINGRKVNGCEETPLPIIVGLQTETELKNGHGVSSKIGITSSEINNKGSPPPPLLSSMSSSSSSSNGIYSNGTIKRASRMKSPPPPPPPLKANNGHENIPKKDKAVANSSETCEKMSSLNTLMRRNVSFGSSGSSRKSCSFEVLGEDADDDESNQLACGGGEINVIQTQKISQASENVTLTTTTSSCSSPDGENNFLLAEDKSTEKAKSTQEEILGNANGVVASDEKQAVPQDFKNDDDDGVRRNEKSNAIPVAAPTDNGRWNDKAKDTISLMGSHSSKEIKEKLRDDTDDTTDILIRPWEISKQSHNNKIGGGGGGDDDDNDNRDAVEVAAVNKSASDGGRDEEKATRIEQGRPFNNEEGKVEEEDGDRKETVNEQNHDTTNKTELDCKDAKEDVAANDSSRRRSSGSGVDTTTPCASAADNEMKPVSCSSNAKKEVQLLIDKKGEDMSKISAMLLANSNKNDGNKILVNDGNKESNCSPDNEDGNENATVEFPELSDKQLETGFGGKSCNVLTNAGTAKLFDVSPSVGLLVDLEESAGSKRSGVDSKFGMEEELQQRIDRRGESSRENTPPKPQQLPPSSSSSPVAAETDPLTAITRTSSTASSRRGSLSSSSVDLNVVTSSNGLLNCNRISLCSLPDNEVDVDSFESPPPPTLDSETILDQPLAWKPNGQILKAEDISTTKGDDQNAHNFNEPKQNGKTKNEKLETDGNSGFHGHHQRKMSVSKIEFDWGKVQSRLYGEKHAMASSAPTTCATSSQLEKRSISRKASFPELYVNTAIVRPSVERKHSIPLAAKASSHENVYSVLFSGDKDNKRNKSHSGRSNDFLQTLGEIYACKSKLLTSATTQHPPSPIIAPCTNDPASSSAKDLLDSAAIITSIPDPISSEKLKSRDASMDTVDGFESQDRSISEYNISPRSARELVTESLLNGTSSLCSSTVSQISIVTINDENQVGGGATAVNIITPTAPVPFSAGIKTGDPFGEINITTVKSGDDTTNALKSGSLTNGNSATYRKKPSFCRARIAKEDSIPSVEIFEPPSSSKNVNRNIDASNTHVPADTEEKPVMPIPPPMPPLQFCRNNSYSSTASSSMGDSSSETQEKSKSPCFDENIKPINKVASRTSPDKSIPKLNGNGSSECSLIELSLANQRSTSDAIIVELKKAQAKKLKFAEQRSTEVCEQRCSTEQSRCIDKPATVAIVQVSEQVSGNSGRQVESAKNVLGEIASGPVRNHQQTISENNHVGDTSVKTIVNGKHTNSIIVNETPIVLAKKESLKRTRSGVCPTKSSTAQQRGNIMSPSLSGNYTEMNGIDSETMGASSIHEDELSGHLKQKENHINELHDNADEVQVSNKLDGASFRRVLSEYEKTLSMFIQQIDQLKTRMDEAETEKQTLIKERDQALEDLRNVESAFSDVHRKYERAKALLENMKSNEDTLIRRDQEMMQRIQNRDKKIDLIKEKAQESIEKMHLDYETRIKEMDFENAKLRAQYRKMEMKLSTLENDVEQKAKENAQLSALCDELINGQVGQV